MNTARVCALFSDTMQFNIYPNFNTFKNICTGKHAMTIIVKILKYENTNYNIHSVASLSIQTRAEK